MSRKTEVNREKDIVFLKGFKTILRPLNQEADLEKCVKWINDPEIRKFLLRQHPFSLEDEKKWFDSQVGNFNRMHLAIDTIEGEYIGNIGMHEIDFINRHATTGTIIGEKNYWGKGYGTDAKMQLLSHAFLTLGLHRIGSSVIAFNKRSIAYSKKCGYREEGIIRDFIWRDGRWHDEIMLGVIYDDWLPVWKKYNQLQNGQVC